MEEKESCDERRKERGGGRIGRGGRKKVERKENGRRKERERWQEMRRGT